MNKRAAAMPVAILLGLITSMTVFILFMILTPVWNQYANTLASFINTQIAHVPSLSAAQTQITTLTTQWAIMFFVAFLSGIVTVYASAYREEPDPYYAQGYEEQDYE